MFETFAEIKKIFDFDIYKLMDKAVKGQTDKIIAFNQGQLQDGMDALGQTITTIGGSPYRPKTVRMRKAKHLQTNKVDLKFTGEFYKTFRVVILQNGYEVTANFEKPDGSILDNFSSSYDFLGLDQASLTEWVDEELFPILAQLIRKKIGL
ncbi:MAG: hypothetical protein DRJ10_07320 [Bacteroidetes bacterium]|nr:MAG: hypothetical protein DRJ10_07320 [Bacteroidota bacterium]